MDPFDPVIRVFLRAANIKVSEALRDEPFYDDLEKPTSPPSRPDLSMHYVEPSQTRGQRLIREYRG